MFKKILIANRGEIALRVLCACKELGIKTVAIYSEADRHALHVRFADEAICIGPPRSSESYLNIPAVMSAAEIANVDAIHPGYGFLSENASFAEVCESCHVKFIGPSPDAMRLMGGKERAREAAKQAGLPILPGSDDIIADADEAARIAAEVGYPVILKASAGGGGRGMRIVRDEADLAAHFAAAQQEAGNSFGNGALYLEKYIESPRHIEFQVLADEHGNVMHLGERECSIQRRHQKLVEESPSPRVSAELRQAMGRRVVCAMKQVGYTNAGTIEFLMNGDGQLYFIEMNTRLQVEHGVTELVAGVDLVKAQIRIAAGATLAEAIGFDPAKLIFPRGHAIECRVNAENPETFAPSAGRITAFHAPGGAGVRVDSAAYSEAEVPPYYDSLIAKVMAHGKDRDEALRRLQRALEMFIVQGIHTSIPLHLKILADAEFRAGDFTTRFMERFARKRP
ncbi:MAG: acetyl-CoA carboxylase biotin carboxylase subunit [Terriglobales bacterium]